MKFFHEQILANQNRFTVFHRAVVAGHWDMRMLKINSETKFLHTIACRRPLHILPNTYILHSRSIIVFRVN